MTTSMDATVALLVSIVPCDPITKPLPISVPPIGS